MPVNVYVGFNPNPTTDNVTSYILNRGTVSGVYTSTKDLGLGVVAPSPLTLPQATTAQSPLTTAYNALNVPALAAGATYADPTTGVTVYKLTSATFPTTSTSWGHDYAEGGHEISLPHTGSTRTVLVRNLQDLTWWLLDFTPGVPGVSNPRQLTANLAPWIDIAFTFSSNPATPQYAFVGTNTGGQGAVRRIDFRAGVMAEAPLSGVWPILSQDSGQVSGFPAWLQQAQNDSFFCWMLGSNGPSVVAYDPNTRNVTTRSFVNVLSTHDQINEPRLDRAGRYIGIAIDTTDPVNFPDNPGNAMAMWDTLTDTITWTLIGDQGTPPNNFPFAHTASLRRRMIGQQYNVSFVPNGPPFWSFDPSVANSAAFASGVSGSGNPQHMNGNWVQGLVTGESLSDVDARLDDQWAIINMYGGMTPPTFGGAVTWLAPAGIMLMTLNGQRRLLAHSYNAADGSVYFKNSFVKFSPDGRYVMFTSDMIGQARSDVFLAEMPTELSGFDTVANTGTYFWALTAQNATGISFPSVEVTEFVSVPVVVVPSNPVPTRIMVG